MYQVDSEAVVRKLLARISDLEYRNALLDAAVDNLRAQLEAPAFEPVVDES